MDEMARAALDPLVVGRVIGDVLDMFVPAVRYSGKKNIANGTEVRPSFAAERPRVRISGSGSLNYYTLASNRHIPEGSDASEGKEVMAYMGPKPPTGIHRYVFAAFRQHGLMETVATKPVERSRFNTRGFATENDLGLPAAALYFNSQKQPAGNKKH